MGVRNFAAMLVVAACFFGAIARPYVQRYHIPLQSAAGIYSCFLLLLVLVMTPGVAVTRQWIKAQLARPWQWAVLPPLWCLPYLLYAAGTGDWRWIAPTRLLAVSVPVLLIYRLIPVRDLARFSWQDLAVAVWLIAVLLGHQLVGIWTEPANLDFMGRLFLISIASWSWVFLRPVPELGYEFSLSAKTFGIAAWNFALFGVIAIPASLAMRFTQWNPLHSGVLAFGVAFVEIFLFIALLEELFFRGFLQTLISQNLRSSRLGQILISCLFGLFHILHAPFPNWRYVLLATVAGWFYGSAYVKSGNLMTSALTHAMVDTVWRQFFSKS